MRLIDWLFGCNHTRYSWPLSVKRGRRCKPYVCCLECGKEFAYDWEEMHMEYEPDWRDAEGFTDAPAELEMHRNR